MSKARPAPAPRREAPADGARRAPWILNSRKDLALFIATPLLLVPLFALARERWGAEDISIFVAAFGAMGHHVPGMIRAYGDRALFDRFRTRFLLAPVFLAAACIGFYWMDLKGITLIVLAWGIWHGMMQTYGFSRIYDAKMQLFTAWTSRLDFALCAAWFAAAVLLSPSRMGDILEAYYGSGGLRIPSGLLDAVRSGALLAAISITVLFLANVVRSAARRQPVNLVKFALLGGSIGFWWYCNNHVASILVGIALFEVFHDIQYLSLVWTYNRSRVEKDRSIGGLMRFVFRNSGALAGLYVGIVLAYGFIGFFSSGLPAGAAARILTGLVAASALLHFYYDGFIWKVRDAAIRQSLKIDAPALETRPVPGASGFAHASRWAAAFALPLALLGAAQLRGLASSVDRAEWIVQDLPRAPMHHLKYAIALQQSGRTQDAIRQYEVALELDPDDPIAHYNFASLLLSESRIPEAAAEYIAAIRLEPRDGGHHYGYARTLERLGADGNAGSEYAEAVRLEPRSASFHLGYAAYLARLDRFDDAIAQYREVLRLEDGSVSARLGLANALYAAGRVEESEAYYLEALRLQPGRGDVHANLGHIYIRLGKIPQAIAQYREALRLDPTLEEAAANLRAALAAASPSNR